MEAAWSASLVLSEGFHYDVSSIRALVFVPSLVDPVLVVFGLFSFFFFVSSSRPRRGYTNLGAD